MTTKDKGSLYPMRNEEMSMENQYEPTDKEKEIARFILGHGMDAPHHMQWTLDQVLRMLLQDKYKDTVLDFCWNDDEGVVGAWETGVAP